MAPLPLWAEHPNLSGQRVQVVPARSRSWVLQRLSLPKPGPQVVPHQRPRQTTAPREAPGGVTELWRGAPPPKPSGERRGSFSKFPDTLVTRGSDMLVTRGSDRFQAVPSDWGRASEGKPEGWTCPAPKRKEEPSTTGKVASERSRRARVTSHVFRPGPRAPPHMGAHLAAEPPAASLGAGAARGLGGPGRPRWGQRPGSRRQADTAPPLPFPLPSSLTKWGAGLPLLLPHPGPARAPTHPRLDRARHSGLPARQARAGLCGTGHCGVRGASPQSPGAATRAPPPPRLAAGGPLDAPGPLRLGLSGPLPRSLPTSLPGPLRPPPGPIPQLAAALLRSYRVESSGRRTGTGSQLAGSPARSPPRDFLLGVPLIPSTSRQHLRPQKSSGVEKTLWSDGNPRQMQGGEGPPVSIWGPPSPGGAMSSGLVFGPHSAWFWHLSPEARLLPGTLGQGKFVPETRPADFARRSGATLETSSLCTPHPLIWGVGLSSPPRGPAAVSAMQRLTTKMAVATARLSAQLQARQLGSGQGRPACRLQLHPGEPRPSSLVPVGSAPTEEPEGVCGDEQRGTVSPHVSSDVSRPGPRGKLSAGPPGAELDCLPPLLRPEQPQTQELGLRGRRRWRSLAASDCGLIPPVRASAVAWTRPLCAPAPPIAVSLRPDHPERSRVELLRSTTSAKALGPGGVTLTVPCGEVSAACVRAGPGSSLQGLQSKERTLPPKDARKQPGPQAQEKKCCGQKKADVQAGEAAKVLQTRKGTNVRLQVPKLPPHLASPPGGARRRSPQGGAAGPPRRRDAGRGTRARFGCNAAGPRGSERRPGAPPAAHSAPSRRGRAQRADPGGGTSASPGELGRSQPKTRLQPLSLPGPLPTGLQMPRSKVRCAHHRGGSEALPPASPAGPCPPGRVALTVQQGMTARAGLPPPGRSSRSVRVPAQRRRQGGL
ncbi:collagen alpha-1(I) chain-like [Phyllostomus hastatus]|uniref:collagen alpha-1(I) chain-like n=1 Tax=Phyllostomus hastatus TaxID=9423 RepID=UPI001E6853AB|nr:collagen alpha-1(I) chain-like [Phyllostomus hastatus]